MLNRSKRRSRIHSSLTSLTSIIDEDDFREDRGRGSVNDAVNSSHERWPGFVVKHDNDGSGWESLPVFVVVDRATLFPPYVRQCYIQRYSVASHYIEPSHLKQLVHFGRLKRRDYHSFSVSPCSIIRVEQIRVQNLCNHVIGLNWLFNFPSSMSFLHLRSYVSPKAKFYKPGMISSWSTFNSSQRILCNCSETLKASQWQYN